MADYFNPKFGAVVPLTFSVANAVTNQSNVDLAGPAAGTTVIAMPYSGSVIGISVTPSTNVTAGSATFRVHSASTEVATTGYPAPVLNATNSNVSYATVAPGAIRFSAGARLGVSYSSATDMAPTDTNDYNATLWVVIDPD